jgi:hypothetical protein
VPTTEVPPAPPPAPGQPATLRAWAPWLLLAILAPTVLLTWLWTAPTGGYLSAFAGCLYWFAVAIVALALAVGVWRWRRRDVPAGVLLRRHAPGLAVAMIATVVVRMLVPAQMRVQFDETSLVGVSQCMHEQRLAVMTTGALPFDGAPAPLEQIVDKRPPLFAFLVSLMHDLLGYTPENALRLNALLLAIGLFVASAAMRDRLGLAAALTAPLLLLAVPLVPVVATGGGFEPLAALLFALVLLAALDVVARPDPVRWCTFLVTGVLFAWSRYESLAVFAGIVLLVLQGTRGRNQCTNVTRIAFAAMPLAVAPLVLLLAHARNPGFYPEAGGQQLVSLQHALGHLPGFVAAFFDIRLDHALPGPLAVIGLVAAAWWGWRHRSVPYRALLVAMPVFGVTALVLFWFFGNVEEPTALRLFLPASVLGALSPLLLLRVAGRSVALPLLAFSALIAVLRLRELHLGRAFPEPQRSAMVEILDRLVQRHDDGSGRILWVGSLPQALCIRGRAGLTVEAFQRRRSEVGRLRLQGDLRTLFLYSTPFDRDLAPAFGEPRELLSAFDYQVVEKVDSPHPFMLYRLQP